MMFVDLKTGCESILKPYRREGHSNTQNTSTDMCLNWYCATISKFESKSKKYPYDRKLNM